MHKLTLQPLLVVLVKLFWNDKFATFIHLQFSIAAEFENWTIREKCESYLSKAEIAFDKKGSSVSNFEFYSIKM